MDRTYKTTDVVGVGTTTLSFDNSVINTLNTGESFHLAVSSTNSFTNYHNISLTPLTEIAGSETFYTEVDFPDNSDCYFKIIEDIDPEPHCICTTN